ncbi:MAG: phosphatase PAP2 family protein [Saprospiraceae bacterium]|nr:phosphatase PAP2 family protein [Saprospiraceae bacterium]
MKKFNFLFVLASFFSFNAFSQKAALPKLSPISGHYKALAKLSGQPKPDATDRNQFPLEILSPKNALKLKLTPQYLILPVSDFKIPNFPANSSEQTKAEIEFLLKLQAEVRTEEKVKESLEFANVYYNVFVVPTDSSYAKMRKNLFHMGRQLPWFSPDKLPVTAAFMTKVWSDCTYYFWALKFQYNRTRPYMIDSRIKNLEDTKFQAYPSGHASASYVAAYVYQELLPESKDLFLKNAFDMAYSREILGVHFPSDSEAGRIFARQFVNELLKTEQFRKDLAEAKKEILSVKNANNQ